MRIDEFSPAVRKIIEDKLLAEEYRHQASDTYAKLEQDTGDESVAEEVASRLNPPLRVAFCHHRKRLIDLDNLCIKAVLDGLRIAGVFEDDSPAIIQEISHRQVKSDEEFTEVSIEEIR
jgi:Holliday junction resolvase RusA-like endonuclease